MKIISTKNLLSALLIGAIYAPSAYAAPPSTSAYATDAQHSYVQDATSEQIGTTNMITCIMSALRPDALVNQGNYIALVDRNKCDQNHSNSGATGGASQAADYMTGTVNSTRASNQDPMVVKTWLDQVEDSKSTQIYVHINATEAPSSANAYGTFRLDFCGKATGATTNVCNFNGYLQGSSSGLRFFEADSEPGSNGGSSTTALQLTTGSSTGQGAIHAVQTQGGVSQNSDFPFAYDANHFLRGDQCFSRDATDPETGLSVWRYGLYDAVTGVAITRNSGFPIVYTSGGTTYNGYLGYGGLSLPPAASAAIHNGDTVQKVDYNGSAAVKTDYRVVQSGGKLTKYTKRLTSLDKLDQVKFTTFVNTVAGFYVGADPNVHQYELYWNEASGDFIVDAAMQCDQSGCHTQDLAQPRHVLASFWSQQGGIQGWSNSLNGQLFIDLHAGVSPSTGANVVYRTQDLVYPAEMQTLGALNCVRDCPTMTSLNAYFVANSTMTPFVGASANNWNATPAGSVVGYTLDATNVVLVDANGQSVVFTDADAMAAHSQYQFGITSGRLFKASDLAAIDCGSPNSGQYCDFKVDGLDVYYQWQTGSGNWNQFAAVKDSQGNYVQFDAPLQVSFTVPSDPIRYHEYAGQTMVLQYGGFGDLWGIPGTCVSMQTNEAVSCENQSQDTRYVPAFVIPYDAVLGKVTSGTTTYLVKWLEREIRFAAKNLSACAGLTAPTNIVLPTAAELKDPSNPSSDIYIGPKPEVTNPPRVIQGEVKY